MIKSYNITYTKRTDWQNLQDICASNSSDHILIQVFSGHTDPDRINILLSELREDFPGIGILGTTTAGEIVDGQSQENTVLINITIFEHTTVKTGLTAHSANTIATAKYLSQNLQQDDTKAIIMYAGGIREGQQADSSPLLQALHQENPDVIIAGGQAGDNDGKRLTYVFTERGISSDGIAAASLAGTQLQTNNFSSLNWTPVGRELLVTKARGRQLYTLDDQPAAEAFRHYLDPDIFENLPHSAIDFPLILERDGVSIAAHPLSVHKDGSIDISMDIMTGDTVRFGFCHTGLLAQSAKTTHNQIYAINPQAIFVVSCLARKWVLEEDLEIELSAFRNLAPTAGFFSYGEYFTHENGHAYLFNHTQTILALAEHDEEPPKRGLDRTYQPQATESRQFRSLCVLHRLVDITTREIEGINMELSKLVSRDALTGLANRRRFDERMTNEIKNQNRSKLPMSLILLDVDFFKQYNDSYGHVYGDECLRIIAEIIQQVAKRPTDTGARYGGEEFACILPMTDQAGAKMLAEEIRQRIEEKAIPHDRSEIGECVTASLGVLTVSPSLRNTSSDIIAHCDRLLYSAKEQGRNCIMTGSIGFD